MSKDAVNEYDVTDVNNSTVNSVDIAEGCDPGTINNAIRSIMSHQKEKMLDDGGISLTVAGTDTNTVTVNQVFAAYADGFSFAATVTNASTGASTMNVTPKGGSALGAKAIKKNVAGTETAIGAGDIAGGGMYRFIYDSQLAAAAGGFWVESLNLSDGTTYISNVVEDTSPQSGGAHSMNSFAMQWAEGAEVASATELLVLKDGNCFDVSGTTAITSIEESADAWGIGSIIALHFEGALTFTHHSTDLILPGAANITTAAGDVAIMHKYAAGDWRCINYQRAVASYTSSEQTITAAGSLTLAHGLSGIPTLIQAHLVCQSSDRGYSIGDIVLTIPTVNPVSSSFKDFGISCVPDATNLNIRYGSASTTFSLLDKSTGNYASLTNVKWKLVMKAWY
ncbi:MAG: hypothetical protein GY761_03205 [Hyphomicrobiales bacterium]|nr:hypothetical protein [Hyphomicrobiales bacterium]